MEILNSHIIERIWSQHCFEINFFFKWLLKFSDFINSDNCIRKITSKSIILYPVFIQKTIRSLLCVNFQICFASNSQSPYVASTKSSEGYPGIVIVLSVCLSVCPSVRYKCKILLFWNDSRYWDETLGI